MMVCRVHRTVGRDRLYTVCLFYMLWNKAPTRIGSSGFGGLDRWYRRLGRGYLRLPCILAIVIGTPVCTLPLELIGYWNTRDIG